MCVSVPPIPQPGLLLVLTQTSVNTVFLQWLQFGELYQILLLLKWRESECADMKKCVCWKKKNLLALKQICILSVNILSMSEENFSVKMGCVSALCVNNSSEV